MPDHCIEGWEDLVKREISGRPKDDQRIGMFHCHRVFLLISLYEKSSLSLPPRQQGSYHDKKLHADLPRKFRHCGLAYAAAPEERHKRSLLTWNAEEHHARTRQSRFCLDG